MNNTIVVIHAANAMRRAIQSVSPVVVVVVVLLGGVDANHTIRSINRDHPQPRAKVTTVRDFEIREALVKHLRADHADPVVNRIWSEFAVCLGASRVDVCLINGSLSGFEIKSPRDNFGRLPSQVEHYGRVLDFACIVTGDKHAQRVVDAVPSWWGVLSAAEVSVDGQLAVELEWARQPTRNPEVDPFSVAQLLWRDEAFDVLRGLDAHAGLQRSTRWDVWDRLVETVTLDELRDIVRDRLKARPSRQADELLEPSGVR